MAHVYITDGKVHASTIHDQSRRRLHFVCARLRTWCFGPWTSSPVAFGPTPKNENENENENILKSINLNIENLDSGHTQILDIISNKQKSTDIKTIAVEDLNDEDMENRELLKQLTTDNVNVDNKSEATEVSDVSDVSDGVSANEVEKTDPVENTDPVEKTEEPQKEIVIHGNIRKKKLAELKLLALSHKLNTEENINNMKKDELINMIENNSD